MNKTYLLIDTNKSQPKEIDFSSFSQHLGWCDWDKIVEILISNGWGSVRSITLIENDRPVRRWVPSTYEVLEPAPDGEWRRSA